MKHNFAEKITIVDLEYTTKASNENSSRRRGVNSDINRYKVDIDRESFKKSKTDRLKLKEAKLNHSAFPNKGRNEVLRSFINSEFPKWGSLSFKLTS